MHRLEILDKNRRMQAFKDEVRFILLVCLNRRTASHHQRKARCAWFVCLVSLCHLRSNRIMILRLNLRYKKRRSVSALSCCCCCRHTCLHLCNACFAFEKFARAFMSPTNRPRLRHMSMICRHQVIALIFLCRSLLFRT